ncbi:ATP-dependent Clp protease ATP-binding subunit [Butyricicoccus intestinisimiae]|uniref:ATP-dependent Clp protease ATP-binding subunit n=1 Tax=Butyricicoccus intestinisimiae TaxID=2841509 RepID=A0ABS6ERD3_9FIRM|nr:ATP-dependent Clp protease ATP-binding subunit [Butyricicoccus intestinisimiae]MBU5490260.1 ATP-dependent Clp protease ATP-binding subunit [Butyricicoccus intestinisimiae]
MHMPLCSRCHKNVAVVFISKMEEGSTSNEGYCLKCAKELGLKPIDGLMRQMGITEDDLDQITDEMTNMHSLMNTENDDAEDEEIDPDEDDADGQDDSFDFGGTHTFPFLDKMFSGNDNTEAPREESGTDVREDDARRKKKEAKKRKNLSAYCTDLTYRAREGQLDAIIGRDSETERVIQILNRRQKNNPCLIGEPGVGKTAVAEGLAIRIAKGDVPYKLKNKEVHLLDLTSLVAGTQFRGQFEGRMKGLINEIKSLGNIILVIDEVHNIVGAGDAEGSMNAANILKPALSRGEIQVIGATTFAEYRKYIEKDAALERRFQPVTIAEPSITDTAEILKGVRGYYETFHGVHISDEICHQAAALSERYITDRFLPDKAIDLIDEACSRLNLDSPATAEIPELGDKLEDIHRKQDDLLQLPQNNEVYEQMAELKSLELQTENKLTELRKIPVPELTAEHLASVIELWTGVPASKVCEQEFSRLIGLEERLHRRVVGQEKAVSAVAHAVRRSRAGISPKHKPVSFLFVGPTGVGKTELVKALAEDLFDTPEALIRLDMSEYMEKHTVSRLIGSPPGYVGFDEAGQLTEKLRRRPYSVVLFDEIEKAHPDVLNILLQVLDDGRITDAQGRTVSFENAIIIMTSNAGSDRSGGSVGFGKTVSEQDEARAVKALEEIMRPEFLNRIDDIISFSHLTKEDFRGIAAIMLGQLRDTLAENNIRLTWDDSLVDYLIEDSFSVKFGARNLRRAIEKQVEDELANRIIAAWEHPLSGAHVSAADGKILVQTI